MSVSLTNTTATQETSRWFPVHAELLGMKEHCVPETILPIIRSRWVLKLCETLDALNSYRTNHSSRNNLLESKFRVGLRRNFC